MQRAGGVTSFELLLSLERAPPEVRDSLAVLRRFIAENGGVIRLSDLERLSDPMARKVAEVALAHRAAVEVIRSDLGLPEGDLIPFIGECYARINRSWRSAIRCCRSER